MESQELIEYIKSSVSEGKSKEEIYKELIEKGLKIEEIEKAFHQAILKRKKATLYERIIKIITIFGAIFIAAGIFSFIAANWPKMPKELKVSIILISMLSFYGAGWFFREKKQSLRLGEALIFLGAIIYGAGLFLVAQIYHIRGNWPDGFIFWMIGILLMGFASEIFSLFYLAILVGTVALTGHPFIIFESFTTYNPFLLTSSFLLLIATAITFFTGYLLRKRLPREFKEFY